MATPIRSRGEKRSYPARGGRALGALCAAGIALAAFGVAFSSQASASSVIGTAHAPGSGGNTCGAIGGTVVQAASADATYAAPYDGVITSWGSRGWFPAMGFKVARIGAGGTFSVLAADGPRTYTGTAGQLQSYPVRFKVRQGDVLAIQIPAYANHVCFPGTTGDTIRWNAGDVRPGNSSSFQVTQQDQTIPVQATIERDADHDGYGDETQDRCPSDPTLHSVCDTFPPQTTITQGPRKRTTSRTANFAFTSSEPASTFQCSLDGAAFRACTSPMTVTVRRGTHNFLVRARDRHGNLDTTEAAWSWKVVRKRRHR